jgi:hypothetical protein
MLTPETLSYGWASCVATGNHSCTIVASAYRRGRAAGLDEAVEVAKREAYVVGAFFGESNASIDWTEVSAEIERRKGEA